MRLHKMVLTLWDQETTSTILAKSTIREDWKWIHYGARLSSLEWAKITEKSSSESVIFTELRLNNHSSWLALVCTTAKYLCKTEEETIWVKTKQDSLFLTAWQYVSTAIRRHTIRFRSPLSRLQVLLCMNQSTAQRFGVLNSKSIILTNFTDQCVEWTELNRPLIFLYVMQSHFFHNTLNQFLFLTDIRVFTFALSLFLFVNQEIIIKSYSFSR